MAIGDSTAELDLMLADLGVSVRYGSVSVKGLFRRAGEIVEENGIQIALATPQVRVRSGVLGSGLSIENDIQVNGTTYRITDIGKADIEGLQTITIVPVGSA
jgi:hypothetical protein